MKLVEYEGMVYAECKTAIGTFYLRDFTKPDTQPHHSTNFSVPQIMQFEDIFEENIRKNRGYVDAGLCLDQYPKPAPWSKCLICGDGPSLLDHDYDMSRDNLTLFALNRAANKIRLTSRDSVIIVDPNSFSSLGRPITPPLASEEAPSAFFTPFSSPEIVQMPWPKRYFATYGEQGLGAVDFSRDTWPGLPHLAAGILVGYTALEIAWLVGFRKIGLVGYDLTWDSCGRWHAGETDEAYDMPDAGTAPVPTCRGSVAMARTQYEILFRDLIAHAIAFIRSAGGNVMLFGDSIICADALGVPLDFSNNISEWKGSMQNG